MRKVILEIKNNVVTDVIESKKDENVIKLFESLKTDIIQEYLEDALFVNEENCISYPNDIGQTITYQTLQIETTKNNVTSIDTLTDKKVDLNNKISSLYDCARLSNEKEIGFYYVKMFKKDIKKLQKKINKFFKKYKVIYLFEANSLLLNMYEFAEEVGDVNGEIELSNTMKKKIKVINAKIVEMLTKKVKAELI